jgi:hypothetical protein
MRTIPSLKAICPSEGLSKLFILLSLYSVPLKASFNALREHHRSLEGIVLALAPVTVSRSRDIKLICSCEWHNTAHSIVPVHDQQTSSTANFDL